MNDDMRCMSEAVEKARTSRDGIIDCIWLYDPDIHSFSYISTFGSGYKIVRTKSSDLQKFAYYLTKENVGKITERYEQTSPDTGALLLSVRADDDDERYIEIVSEPKNGVILGRTRDVTELEKMRGEYVQTIKKYEEQEHQLNTKLYELQEKNLIFKNLVAVDDLTGLFNRYFFNLRLTEEMERANRYGSTVSLLLFDLDFFRNINDEKGHFASDKILIKIAQSISKIIRKSDIFARWGGDEFAVLMPQTGIDGAEALADKLRVHILETVAPAHEGLSASFGAAEILKGDSVESWFRRADKALYQAKSSGRNRVVANRDPNTVYSVRLDWKDEWNSGVRLLDDQHRQLLEYAQKLLDIPLTGAESPETDKKLDEILELLDRHFVDEERLLQKIQYKDAARHAESHKTLNLKTMQLKALNKLGELRPATLYNFLIDEFLAGHVLTDDVQYFDITKNKAQYAIEGIANE